MAEELKVAIVTGSTRGIGLEIARTLATEGYNVMLSGRNEEALVKVKDELESVGLKVSFCKADISKAEDATKLVAYTLEVFGRVDILVNNAGVTCDNLLMRMDEDAWDKVLNTNLKGAFLMTKAVIKPMLKQKKGAIVNIASVVGLMGNAGQANYAASKAGLIGFTKSVAKEYGKKGIRVNAVAPGFICSDMTAKLADNLKEQMLAQVPLNVFGQPQDVANAVSFLASDKASYITGQVLTVDGGMVMA
jgi:3-oxoacyl-[acyl-carrier protein] reductase